MGGGSCSFLGKRPSLQREQQYKGQRGELAEAAGQQEWAANEEMMDGWGE